MVLIDYVFLLLLCPTVSLYRDWTNNLWVVCERISPFAWTSKVVSFYGHIVRIGLNHGIYGRSRQIKEQKAEGERATLKFEIGIDTLPLAAAACPSRSTLQSGWW